MQQRTEWPWVTLGTLFAVICLSGTEPLFAQSKNQFGSDYRNRRSVSPYLSLMDNGNGNGGLNYYNIVKPQQRARQTARNLQNELHQVESSLAKKPGQTSGPPSSIPITTGRMNPTGHPTSYGNTGSYFGGGTGNGVTGGAENRFGRNGKN